MSEEINNDINNNNSNNTQPNSNTNNSANNSNNTDNQTENKVHKYAERFNDIDTLEKSYLELEKEHNRKANELFKLKSKIEELEKPKKSVTELIKEKIENNLPIDYDEFKELGITKEVVDIVKHSVETSKALEQQEREQKLLQAQNYLGENRDEVVSFTNEFFAGETFTDSEREYIKKMNDENPLLLAKFSKVLHESYQQTTSNNSLFNPFTSRMGKANDVFKNESELREAMRDKRFKEDKVYRQSVLAKMSRSNLR